MVLEVLVILMVLIVLAVLVVVVLRLLASSLREFWDPHKQPRARAAQAQELATPCWASQLSLWRMAQL